MEMNDNPYLANARSNQRAPLLLRTDAMVLHKISVLSASKVLGAFYAFLGLVVGGVVALYSIAVAAAQAQPIAEGSMGLFSVILFPIFYGILGFIGGALFAAFYNLVASQIGGIEIVLKSTPSDGC